MHVAKLVTTGQRAAVKVQHEGVAVMMVADMVAFKRIVRFSAWMNEKLSAVVVILTAWEKEMLKELDFNVSLQPSDLRRVLASRQCMQRITSGGGGGAHLPAAMRVRSGRSGQPDHCPCQPWPCWCGCAGPSAAGRAGRQRCLCDGIHRASSDSDSCSSSYSCSFSSSCSFSFSSSCS